MHVHHGIGRFAGIERMRVDGVDKDYIKICYAGNDSLYVLATQLDMVSKYIGGHGEDEDGQQRTKLSKLGGTDWSRAKTKARAAKDLAKGSSRSTPSANAARASPFRPTPRGRRNLKKPSTTKRPTISSAPSPRSRPTWSAVRRWTACSAATSATARLRSRCAP